MPRISYDYQAALGEFGQVRESYRRVKSIHYFVQQFGDRLCALKTVLPEGAEKIAPKDSTILRYAVRTDGERGFLFLNNYQDHFALPDRKDDEISLQLRGEELKWDISIASDENAILPFHFDMDGIDLVKANAQVLTRIVTEGEVTYVFFVPDGMCGSFEFEEGTQINGVCRNIYRCGEKFKVTHCGADSGITVDDVEYISTECFMVEKNSVRCKVLVLNREMADNMYLLSGGRLAFTDTVLMEDADGIRLESTKASNMIYTYPAGIFAGMKNVQRIQNIKNARLEYMGAYQVETEENNTEVTVKQVASSRYTIEIPNTVMDGVKDALLQIDYTGDIGNAFINGRMINDNFANGAVWEIGLKDFAEELKKECITIYIVPLKEGVNVNVESAMAARSEEVDAYVAELKRVQIQPIYEMRIG